MLMTQPRSDTTTTPLGQGRWQCWLMKPRDRRERLAAISLIFPAAVLTCLVVNDLVRESYLAPAWFTPLAILLTIDVVAAHTVWYWRRTPVTAASQGHALRLQMPLGAVPEVGTRRNPVAPVAGRRLATEVR